MAAHDSKRAGFCMWIDRADGSVECKYCQAIRAQPTTRKCPATHGSTPPQLRSVRECRQCIHLGEVLRLLPAICCGGKKTKHKIFACAVHGECQLGPVFPAIARCRNCEAFTLARIESAIQQVGLNSAAE